MDTENENGQARQKFPTKLELMGLSATMRPHPVEDAAKALTREEEVMRTQLSEVKEDVVNHPSHYTFYQGLEVIDLTEQMNFNRGNAVKHIARAGLKNKNKEIEDLEKAAWYIQREIDRLKNAGAPDSGLERLHAALTGVTTKGQIACTGCGQPLMKAEGMIFCTNKCQVSK